MLYFLFMLEEKEKITILPHFFPSHCAINGGGESNT